MSVDVGSAHQRLRQYAASLADRLNAQEAWHDRNPGYEQYWTAPESLLSADPYPDTGDVLTARTFCDVMLVALAALEEAQSER